MNGIAGIGKSTFLDQIKERAHRLSIPIVRIDGYVGFLNISEFLHFLCSRLGFSDEDEHMKDIPNLTHQLVERIALQRTVLLFDHFEELVSLESFIRTELIPQLPARDMLLVFASRQGLSLGWRIVPSLITRIKYLTLNYFSWQQSLNYIERMGITDRCLQQKISHETSGYPLALALALAAQAAMQSHREGENDVFPLHEISAALIREVSEHLYPLVEALVFLRTGTQAMLIDVLQQEVTIEDYRSLSRLSFVRHTHRGLVVHDVVRAYLLNDLKTRNPQRVDVLFRQTVAVLGRILDGATGRIAYDVSHDLVTLCMYVAPVFFFPNASISREISTRSLPKCESVIETDVTYLHQMIVDGLLAGIVVPNLYSPHLLLDLFITKFPESLRVIHHTDGSPAAFATLLPLCQETIVELPQCVLDVLRLSLGVEMARYRQMSLVETDTMLSLLSAVSIETKEFTFSDLLLSLKVTGWAKLAQRKRCILLNTIPKVDQFYTQLGYESFHSQRQTMQPINLYTLDFRKNSLGRWLVTLLYNTERNHAEINEIVTIDAIKNALQYIRNINMLQETELATIVHLSADNLQKLLLKILTSALPIKPLTKSQQNLLQVTYLQGRTSVILAAQTLNMGRTTYYRHLEQALKALQQVMTEKVIER